SLRLALRPVVERVVVRDVQCGETARAERPRPARRGAEREAAALRVREAPGAPTGCERSLEIRDGEVGGAQVPPDARKERRRRLSRERDVAARDDGERR